MTVEATAPKTRAAAISAAPVRDAATLILIDRSGPVPKVLLGRRHHRHKFMPGKFVFPGRARGKRRSPDAGERTARSARRGAVAAAGGAAQPGVGALPGARGDPRDLRGDRVLVGAKRNDAPAAPAVPGRRSRRRAFIPTSRPCISSRAPSRRRGNRCASTPAFLRPTQPRSRTGSMASSVPMPNWSSSSGCRSRKPRAWILPRSRMWCCAGSKRSIAAGMRHDLAVPFYRTTVRGFMRDLL